jgi:hypothetical protein
MPMRARSPEETVAFTDKGFQTNAAELAAAKNMFLVFIIRGNSVLGVTERDNCTEKA